MGNDATKTAQGINCAKCATRVQYVVTSGEGNKKNQSCLYHIPFMFRVFAKGKGKRKL